MPFQGDQRNWTKRRAVGEIELQYRARAVAALSSAGKSTAAP